ncbi:serine hydrolase [Streptomyces boninensis]|uniref:serine hydrolase n=1 Tax=Streptomyces boninensis TaxID=2039455 RepID=UPI003B20C1D5
MHSRNRALWLPGAALTLAAGTALVAFNRGALPVPEGAASLVDPQPPVRAAQAAERTDAEGAGQSAPPRPAQSRPAPPRPEPNSAARTAAEAVRAALGSGADGERLRYSIAVEDLDTGELAHSSAGSGSYDTASIVKVNILAALLLQAQTTGVALTPEQQGEAAIMIRNSDNKATDTLWRAIGAGEGLARANRTLGLTGTTPGSGGQWGLTQTVAEDQLRLLRAVFTRPSPLTDASQEYIQSLMANVAADQDWGVPAAAPDSAGFVKNGWLPRSASGRWDVNSIGRVDYAGHTLLVSVLSDRHATREAGIALVEKAASTAVHALVAAADTPVRGPETLAR